MSIVETVVPVVCESDDCLAILTTPAAGRAHDAARVLIVVGGPQYRVGAHRMFVKLARELAASGHVVLRFDVRGMGDSSGEMRSFEDLSPDLAAAIDAFEAHAGSAGPLVLFGLCDAASASLLYVGDTQDPRVSALALLNPWARTQASLAQTHLKHYYGQRLLSLAFWRKLASGGVGLQALGGFLRSLGTSLAAGKAKATPASRKRVPGEGDFFEHMRAGAQGFKGPLLVALSETDLTAAEFNDRCSGDPVWQALLRRPGARQLKLAGADHTLSAQGNLHSFANELRAFLASLAPVAHRNA